MVTYIDIANTVTWSKTGKSSPVWVTPNNQSFMFIGDALEEDELFTNIYQFLQCEKRSSVSAKVNFGIVFTNDTLSFFQMAKSDTINKILFCPSCDLMRANGAFKKTLWQYMGNLGMI